MTNNQPKTKDPTQQRIEKLERTVDILRFNLIESLKMNINMIETVSQFAGINPLAIPSYQVAKILLDRMQQVSPIKKQ